MKTKEFRELALQALKEIPRQFRDRLGRLEIIIEDRPDPELLAELGLNQGDLLFGLYQGVPRTEKSFFRTEIYPDRILLFRRDILSVCRSREEVKEEIKKTLIHEIAHHFGFSESQIRKWGY
jgi:predicted Zn-dependent protease with MMP-like domain